MSGILLCAECGERIGVYEPVIAPDHPSARPTSLAAAPELRRGQARVLHATCTRDA